MSILIKGMEMPTGNHEIMIRIPADGRILDQWGNRLNQEPTAVPVPPHGDLIDRKQLIKPDHQHYEYMSDEFYITVRDVEAAPTIIPAEPPKEES